jgi:hypothetical protein
MAPLLSGRTWIPFLALERVCTIGTMGSTDGTVVEGCSSSCFVSVTAKNKKASLLMFQGVLGVVGEGDCTSELVTFIQQFGIEFKIIWMIKSIILQFRTTEFQASTVLNLWQFRFIGNSLTPSMPYRVQAQATKNLNKITLRLYAVKFFAVL